MRVSRTAFAAIIIAAAACTDSTSPKTAAVSQAVAAPPVKSAASTAPASLFSGYSPQSPHWPHITTMMTDFYYGWTPTERAWAGAHYDLAMSGSGSAWRAVNPTVRHIPYALLWTTIIVPSTPNINTGYYTDMKSWYAAHPQYSLEKAFVHRKGSVGDSASRINFNKGSRRWAINPGDAGAIAYDVGRFQRVVGSESGAFIDEASSGDINNWLPPTREYATGTAYFAALTQLVGTVRRGLPGKMVLLNLAEYMTDGDYAAAVGAGGVHLEMFNSFKQSSMISRWVWVGKLTTAGVFVDFVSTYSTQDMAGMATTYPRGNSPTNVQRAKLWELSSYYMAMPATPKLFALQLENQWSKPYSTLWTKAQEANIGHPLATRVQVAHGTDPQGNPYIVYNRDYDRALVIVRIQTGWNPQTYGDATAIPVALPTGEKWLPLNADGTVGAAITSLRLRNSEAAILLKGSKM